MICPNKDDMDASSSITTNHGNNSQPAADPSAYVCLAHSVLVLCEGCSHIRVGRSVPLNYLFVVFSSQSFLIVDIYKHIFFPLMNVNVHKGKGNVHVGAVVTVIFYINSFK